MSSGDKDMVGRLLKQSILTMCKEAVHYESMLEIDGLICIATDNGKRQVVIKIHEIFHKLPRQTLGTLRFAGEEKSFVVKQNSKKPIISYLDTVIGNADHTGGLVEQNNAEDSDSTGDDETSASESRNTRPSGFPENIDKEMHTLAIYKVYKDSKTIDRKRDNPVVADMSANSYERTNTSCPDPSKLHETGSSQTNLSEDLEQRSDQRNHSSSNNIERYPNLQASTLTNIPCKKCNEVLENGTAYEVHNTNVHSVYTCFVCLNTFTSRNNMTRHIRIHSGTKPYSCPRCPERFTRKDDVKRHILRHDYNKQFRCALCNMGYTEKTTMKVHFERDHGSNEFFSCSQCGKCYIRENDFQLHKKSHPEFRQFACKFCIFTGSNSFMYSKHMLLHENGKTYTCSHCNDMKFKDPFIYTSHLKKHRSDQLVTSFRCCFCDMSLTSYDQFVRHEHTHVQTKRHACKICSKVFEWPGHLQDHMLTHGQEQEKTPSIVTSETDASDRQEDSYSPKRDENLNEVKGSVDYWCAECSLGFASERSLEKHILETHEMMDNVSLDLRSNESENDYKYAPGNKEDGSSDNENNDTYKIVTDQDSEERNEHNDDERLKDANGTVPLRSPERIHDEIHDSDRFVKHQTYSEEAEDLSMHRRENESAVNSSVQHHTDNLETENQQFDTASEKNVHVRHFHGSENRLSALNDSSRKADVRSINRLFQHLQSYKRNDAIVRSSTEGHDSGNVPRMSILRSDSLPNQEPNLSPKSKLPKLFNLIFGQSPTEESKGIKTEPDEGVNDRNDVAHTGRYPGDVTPTENYPIIKKIKIEKLDDFGPSGVQSQTDIKSITVSSIPKPSLLNFSLPSYKISSAVGTNPPVSPTHNPPTSVKLKARAPGFEKVVTPEVLFRTKAPFTCEDCNGVFNDFPSFDQHGILVHHSYVCEYCGKVFTAKPNRERHVRYHTGEKPYHCELCDESYFRGDDLKYHRTAKHGDIRPYVCRGCTRSFIWKKDFEKHVRRYPDHK